MVSAGDFRNGVTFDDNGDVYQIIEFQHVKPGKGAAFVRTKIRDVIGGSVVTPRWFPCIWASAVSLPRASPGSMWQI